MNAEFLVASLWGVVVVYWLWTRRPAGDSIGSFRNELNVLEHATPMRVPAAHRLSPAGCFSPTNGALADLGAIVSQPSVSAPAPGSPLVDGRPATRPRVQRGHEARDYKLAGLRRRRRHVLGVLVSLVVVTFLALAATRSPEMAGPQLVADVALGGYVWMLASKARSTKSRYRPASVVRSAPVERPVPAAWGAPVVPAPAVPAPAVPVAVAPVPPREIDPREIDLDGYERAARYRAAHTLTASSLARFRLAPSPDESAEPYGDFASYASLALAQAN